MSLIIASGSNLNDSLNILKEASLMLQEKFDLIQESRIYQSRAVDYENQPDFYNQVLEFKLPDSYRPQDFMKYLLSLEKNFGRNRSIPKGPRTLDLDLIFWGDFDIKEEELTLPHPRWIQRSFVVKPFSELPYFQKVRKRFDIPISFEVEAFPIENSDFS